MGIFLVPTPHAVLTGLAGRFVDVALKLRGGIALNLVLCLKLVLRHYAGTWAFEYLQGWRLHSLFVQPVPVLGHFHRCSLMFRGNPLCVSLCLLPLVLSLDIAEKSLAQSSLPSPFRCLCTLVRPP